ncbi:hypothetical protein R3P38DRAFT_3154341 [Favolaschia claudopus]|uniref:Reverse transcriptase zinc-binding domain-containing protein n=1 Tax=Favolaschia claudopus TaxID=2862362 RepID=A0AAV9YZJ0_9AGAR
MAPLSADLLLSQPDRQLQGSVNEPTAPLLTSSSNETIRKTQWMLFRVFGPFPASSLPSTLEWHQSTLSRTTNTSEYGSPQLPETSFRNIILLRRPKHAVCPMPASPLSRSLEFYPARRAAALRTLTSPQVARSVAYTRFLVSDHKLAIEELRHANRSWRYVERELRLCRLCHAAVEDECHALLICPGHPSLSRLRADFLRDVFMSQPDLRRLTSAPATTSFWLW